MRIPSVLADPFGQGMNSGQGSVVSGQWSVVSGQSSMERTGKFLIFVTFRVIRGSRSFSNH